MYFLPSIFLLFTDSPYSFNLANRKGRGQGHARKGGERRSLERCGGNGGDGWYSGQAEMRWTKQIVHVGVLLPAAAFMQNSFKLMLGEGSLPWLRHRGKLGEAGLVVLPWGTIFPLMLHFCVKVNRNRMFLSTLCKMKAL